jgi:cellulose synthase/poly-beta-1,6-N-acetylglucosamine synthase-like glycosyltransferase
MIYYIAAIHLLLFSVFVANMVYLWRGRKQKAPDVLSRLSVLIPARNEEANLQRLLPSLLRQDYPDFEVIVYDDGSEDGTWEVIHQAQDDRLRAMRGSGPPPGWVGKVHALYQATREASGDVYLFLDADAEFLHPSALCHLAAYHSALPEDSVMTGLTRLLGGGKILVSLVQNAILTGLPWPLVQSQMHQK